MPQGMPDVRRAPPRGDGAKRPGGAVMSGDPIVTATLTDAELASLAEIAAPVDQPTPLREFWRHFSANAGAVSGLGDCARGALHSGVRRRAGASLPGRDRQRRVPQAAGVGQRWFVDVSAGHRCDRTRHPVAADVRRAAVAVDRDCRRRAVDHRRHLPRHGGRVLPWRDRDRDHALDGRVAEPAELAARDRDRRDTRTRADECDARGRRRRTAPLRTHGARCSDDRALARLRDRGTHGGG